MPWYVITKEYDEIEGRSSAFASEWSALGFAQDLINAGIGVLRIEGVGEEIEAAEIAARLDTMRRSRRNR